MPHVCEALNDTNTGTNKPARLEDATKLKGKESNRIICFNFPQRTMQLITEATEVRKSWPNIED